MTECKKCKGRTMLHAAKHTHTQYKCTRCKAVTVVMGKRLMCPAGAVRAARCEPCLCKKEVKK